MSQGGGGGGGARGGMIMITDSLVFFTPSLMHSSTTPFFDTLLGDLGEARGCSASTFVIDKLNPPTAFRRRYAQTVRDSSSSYKIEYVLVIKNFLYPKGRQHCITGSKVMAILLKQRILSIGGVASGRVCNYSLRSSIV